MKRLMMVALLLMCPSALAYEQELKTVASFLNERLAGAARRQVAVVAFTDLQGSTTELGRFLAEELSVALDNQAKGYRVVDRTHLKAILQEHKLAASGIIDPATARQLGKIAGVDALVTGTVTPFGDSVRLSVKALDVNTATMLASTTADVPKTRAVEELLARSVGTAIPAGAPTATGAALLLPQFLSESIRVTVAQAASRPAPGIFNDLLATLSVVVENVSKGPVSLAIEGVDVALADDRGLNWRFNSLTGLPRLGRGSRDDEYSVLGPSERINVIATFVAPVPGGRAAGGQSQSETATWTFSAGALIFTPSGPRRISIGLTGIKPVITRE